MIIARYEDYTAIGTASISVFLRHSDFQDCLRFVLLTLLYFPGILFRKLSFNLHLLVLFGIVGVLFGFGKSFELIG